MPAEPKKPAPKKAAKKARIRGRQIDLLIIDDVRQPSEVRK